MNVVSHQHKGRIFGPGEVMIMFWLIDEMIFRELLLNTTHCNVWKYGYKQTNLQVKLIKECCKHCFWWHVQHDKTFSFIIFRDFHLPFILWYFSRSTRHAGYTSGNQNLPRNMYTFASRLTLQRGSRRSGVSWLFDEMLCWWYQQ